MADDLQKVGRRTVLKQIATVAALGVSAGIAEKGS
jgi:hypothetical protein